LVCCWWLCSLACSLGLLELLLSFLRITVEEKVNHDIPGRARDGATHPQHLTGEHPVEQTDGVASLVVGRNGNIDKAER
jgi:predicted secreted protein